MGDETQTNIQLQSSNTTNLLYPILVGVCVMLSGSAFSWCFAINSGMAKSEVIMSGKAKSSEVRELQLQLVSMQKSIDKLSEKSELDKKQDAQLSKHWKLHGWAKDEINRINFKNGEAPVSWPNLNGPLDWE